MPTLCLTMIVKNESKVIKRCLDSVKDYIDYYVICDTGSTDNTIEIIKETCDKYNIPGEILNHPFENFEHNRSLAVKSAKDKADYLLLMDADFIFKIVDHNFKDKLNLDAYYIKYDSAYLDYRQMLLIKGCYDWSYEGFTHECIGCDNKKRLTTSQTFMGFMFKHLGDGGCRDDKFERDVRLLYEELKIRPNKARCKFYLAQSYKDLGEYDNAIIWYKERVKHDNFAEEIYYSYYQIAVCRQLKGDPFSEFKIDYLRAYRYRPRRLEALYEVVKYCRLHKMYSLGFQLGKMAMNNKYPHGDLLFIKKPIHEYKFFDELGICAHYCKKNDIAEMLFTRILKEKKCGDSDYNRIKENYEIVQEILHPERELNNKSPDKYIKLLDTHKLDTEIWVSLTTIPSRVKYLKSTLDSIKNQTIKVDRINLCIPTKCLKQNEPSEYTLPDEIINDKDITIVYCDKDYGSSTKLLGSLWVNKDKSQNKIIITIDDDIIYAPNIIEKLISRSIMYPDSAIGFCGWNVKNVMKDSNHFYSNLIYEDRNPNLDDVETCDILEGYRAVLYKSNFFGNDIFDYSEFPEDARYVDDVWISGHLAKKGIRRLSIKYNPGSNLSEHDSYYKIWKSNHSGPKKNNNSLSTMDKFFDYNKNTCIKFGELYPDLWTKNINLSSMQKELLDKIDKKYSDNIERININISGNSLSSIENKRFGLIVPTYNRPQYLEIMLKYLKRSTLKNIVIIIIDDKSMDLNTLNLINNFNIKKIPIIKIFKYENKNIHDSVCTGLSLIKNLNIENTCILDSDTIVKKDWLIKLKQQFKKLSDEYKIVSGFNMSNRNHHKIIKKYDNYCIKKSIGGINMLFSSELIDEFLPLINGVRWDYNICTYMNKNNYNIYCLNNSVVQHIGLNGSNSSASQNNFDFDVNFKINYNDDYYYLPCVDSDEYNINNLQNKNINELMEYCNKNDKAIGFNSNGWIKHNLLEYNKLDIYDISQFSGTYVKKSFFHKKINKLGELDKSYFNKNKLNKLNLSLLIPTVHRKEQNYLIGTIKDLLDKKDDNYDEKIIIRNGSYDYNKPDKINDIVIKHGTYDEYEGKLDGKLNNTVVHYGKTYNDSDERTRWRSKQNLDYSLLFKHGLQNSDSDYFLILEDDMECQLDWNIKVRQAIDQSAAFTKMCELGFCAICIPRPILSELADYLWNNYDKKPCDWLIYDYVNERRLKYRECRKSFFQHRGQYSSLDKQIRHEQSLSFN